MKNNRLTEAQIAAIEYMSLPKKGGLTYEEIADNVGVDVRTIYRWKNDDTFYKTLKDKIVRDTADRLPEVLESIPDHIISHGNAAMLRTFLQMHGLLAEKVAVESTVNAAGIDIDAIRRRMEAFRGDSAES